jgi:Protein of unknown function DUF262
MEKPDRSVYTAQDFLLWRETGVLDLTPKFQRRGVWTPAARSFFIDTILQSMPIPPIYIRVTQSPDKKRRIRQIVDGQQRLSCILDFIGGKFRLSRALRAPWGGKTYDGLSVDEQDRIRNYSFAAEIFQGISDREVLQIFSRLNTYSVQLNAQELRNGRYFGEFKNCVYSLAYDHLEFWRRNKIFTERNIARMIEVELTSELVITQIAGMQDKKKTIDSFYSQLEDSFETKEINESRFREVIDLISDTFDTGLGETEFSRPPIFYSLFGTLYHRKFGLEGVELPTPKKSLTKDEKISLNNTVAELSAAIESKELNQEYTEFVTACLRQTDNIRPRQIRLTTIYTKAFQEH